MRKILYLLLIVIVALGAACSQVAEEVTPTPTSVITPAPTATPSPTPTPAPTPIAGNDDLDRAFELESVPQRIVSLSPGATEILFALDQGDKVVGVTNECDYPEEALGKQKVGDYWNLNIEQIVSLEPDLVLSEAYDTELAPRLEQVGLTVIVLQPEDIDGILLNILLVGRVIGAENKAQNLVADIEQRIQAVAARIENASRPGVFYEALCSQGLWTAGSGTFQDILINLAGGKNVGATEESYYELSIEVLLDANEDIDIIIWGDMAETPLESVVGNLPWSGLTAVQNGKVYYIDPDLTNRPGPRIVDCLEEFARVIHPELFQE